MPLDFGRSNCQLLCAVNCVRAYDWNRFFSHISIARDMRGEADLANPQGVVEFLKKKICGMTSYEEDPAKFKRAMRKAARILKKHGM